MKELLEHIAKNLVDDPAAVSVVESVSAGTTTLKLSVASDDMGKVIGKQGKIAKSIRSVVKAAAINMEKRVVVEIE